MRKLLPLLILFCFCALTPVQIEKIAKTPNVAQWQTKGRAIYKNGVATFPIGLYYPDYTCSNNNAAEQARVTAINGRIKNAGIDWVHAALDSTPATNNDATVAAANAQGIALMGERNNCTIKQMLARYPSIQIISNNDDMDHQNIGIWDKPVGCTGALCGPTGVTRDTADFHQYPPFRRLVYGNGGYPTRMPSFFGTGLDLIGQQCYPINSEGLGSCQGSYYPNMAGFYRGAFVAIVQLFSYPAYPTGYEVMALSDEAFNGVAKAAGVIYYTDQTTAALIAAKPDLWQGMVDWVAWKRYGQPKPYKHYTMDDNAATTVVVDNIQNAANGTANRNTSVFGTASGKISRALDFYTGSVADKVNVGAMSATDFSICAFIQPDSLGGTSTGRIASANGDTNYFNVVTDGASGYKLNMFAGTAIQSATVQASFAATYFHVCATRASSTCTMYVNGAVSGTPANCGASAMATDFYIGAKSDNTLYFDGRIDDFRFYTSALTAAQVSWIYNSGNGR
jgi:hypothetical protein